MFAAVSVIKQQTFFYFKADSIPTVQFMHEYAVKNELQVMICFLEFQKCWVFIYFPLTVYVFFSLKNETLWVVSRLII